MSLELRNAAPPRRAQSSHGERGWKRRARLLRAAPAAAMAFALLALVAPGRAEALGSPKIYVVDSSGYKVSVVDAGTNTVVGTIPVIAPYDIATTSSPTPRAYVTSPDTGTVTVIDTTRDVIVGTIQVGGQPTGVAISNDLRRAYVTNYTDPFVSVIDTTTNSVVGTIPVNATSMDIAILDARTYHFGYVTNYEEGTLSIINLTQNTLVSTIPVGLFPDAVVATDDLPGPRVYVANSGESTVTVLDARTGISTVNLGAVAFPAGLAIDTDPFDPRVYVASITLQPGGLATIDADTNTVARAFGNGALTDVAISEGLATPRLYVLNDTADALQVLNPDTGATVASVPVGTAPTALAIQN
ncbi:YncE family protein [Parafrankia sp. EUN1f]|uniref:YncE family protein n=1 Tax=Parafrankia sp. EUN1f TaxID=102897 RepID=UPI0001C44743|nr:YncE family protein [Parafrankia sp. EUN1f]EFC82990.1 40-residue YVTN family beta-propeller repeat protein [Parafrankia sp. EUN1f]